MEQRTVTASQWDLYIERIRTQLPAAPEGLLNGYMTWVPWLAIVFGAFGILVFLATTVLAAVLTPLAALGGAGGVQAGGMLLVTALLGLAFAVLDVVGGILMLKRRLTGWWLLAVGLAINLISGLLSVSAVGLVITLLIAYVHIQVKPRYS